MRGMTIDQMGAIYYTYKDPVPSAWLMPLTLPGLRGFWANLFDQSHNWYDQSGAATANNLTAAGCTISDIDCAPEWPAVLAPYMEFDGTNDYYTINDNAALSITGDLTIGAWVYADVVNKWQAIVNKGRTSDNDLSYHLLLTDGGVPRLNISDDGTTAGGHLNTVNWSAAIGATAWHFVCARFDAGSSLSIKVDNGAWTSNTTSIVAAINDSARPFRIGEYNETAAYRWNGRVAQAWICAFYVNDEHVDRVYEAQAPLFGTAFP